jgi:sugar phosphate permease
VIFGWIAAAHQVGAAVAAMGAGAIRTSYGDYRPAFLISGLICFLAGLSFLFTRRLLDRRGPHASTPSLAPAMARATP